MKIISLAILPGLILIVNAPNALAQNSDKNVNSFSFTSGVNNTFKNTAIVNDKSGNMATSYIRVMQSFTRHFEKATSESWYRIKNNFVVHFISDGQQTNAVFNKKGKLIYTLSNCSEKDLSPEKRELVKNRYFNYKIARVIKTYHDGINFLIVQLEDDKSFVNLWWENGQMQEALIYQKFK